MTDKPTLDWSTFALRRHKPGTGHSYSTLTYGRIAELALENWENRIPGAGETDLTRKVVVPLKEGTEYFANNTIVNRFDLFFCNTVKISDLTPIRSEVARRAPEEDPFVASYLDPVFLAAVKTIDPYKLDKIVERANFVNVVCYSAEALLENGGTRTTDCDWEIVALICSPVEKEPMHFLTMARNMLEKTGGTKSTYTAEEFAESVYYWSQRVKIQ